MSLCGSCNPYLNTAFSSKQLKSYIKLGPRITVWSSQWLKIRLSKADLERTPFRRWRLKRSEKTGKNLSLKALRKVGIGQTPTNCRCWVDQLKCQGSPSAITREWVSLGSLRLTSTGLVLKRLNLNWIFTSQSSSNSRRVTICSGNNCAVEPRSAAPTIFGKTKSFTTCIWTGNAKLKKT